VKIETLENRDDIYDRKFVRGRSDKIRFLIEKVADKHNISFVDSRDYIWLHSSKQLIHGPLDWKHFNKEGYTALAEAVIALIEPMNEVNEGVSP